jgi:hypothetical protein
LYFFPLPHGRGWFLPPFFPDGSIGLPRRCFVNSSSPGSGFQGFLLNTIASTRRYSLQDNPVPATRPPLTCTWPASIGLVTFAAAPPGERGQTLSWFRHDHQKKTFAHRGIGDRQLFSALASSMSLSVRQHHLQQGHKERTQHHRISAYWPIWLDRPGFGTPRSSTAGAAYLLLPVFGTDPLSTGKFVSTSWAKPLFTTSKSASFSLKRLSLEV